MKRLLPPLHFIFVLALLGFLPLTHAQQASDEQRCEAAIWTLGEVKSSRVENKKCMLMVQAANHPSSDIYRMYILNSEGKLLVFNSFGTGPSSSKTGARVFFFFPRTQLANSILSENQVFLQTASSSAVFIVDQNTAEISGMMNGEVQIDPDISQHNNGGIKIIRHPGLILDVGFSMGKDPTLRKNNQVAFEDHHGRRCLVKNNDIFNYPDSFHADLKFATDSDLSDFLKKRCSNLEILF